MQYPQLSLQQANGPYMEELKAIAAEVIEGGWYIRGKYVGQLERQLCDYVGCRRAIGVGNGLDALRLILRAYIEMGVMQPGDEVIVPADTYVATVLAVTDNALTPVFVEPSLSTYNLDSSLVEQAITPRTRAIMVVHLYGRACWDDRLKAIARRHNLKIIEDNAQSLGAISPVAGWNGSHRTGALGDAAALSFYPTKNLGALGDAGAVLTDDEELADAVKALGNYGSHVRYLNLYEGWNSRMDDLQAAFLSVKLKHLDADNLRRAEVAKLYTELIDNEKVALPEPGEPGEHVWHQYVVRCAERDRLQNYLAEQGIGTIIHYPIPPHRQPCYSRYNHLQLLVAERIANEVLSLPMAAYLSDADVAEIASVLNRFK